ncbi:MAG: helix-turn-helix domain-containing protein [Bacteroidetes bacterium]|nr:helix-turn-helix domain-containing protein [Bacteroidota bacterium]
MDEQIRKTAITRYLAGESPKTIYTDLKQSKKWFFKWLKRYKSGEKNWYKDKSRAPKKRPKQIADDQRQRIIQVRKRLESEPFAQVGVSAIKWELQKTKHGFPSDSTINRVLNREGLVKKNSSCSQRHRVPLFHGGT